MRGLAIGLALVVAAIVGGSLWWSGRQPSLQPHARTAPVAKVPKNDEPRVVGNRVYLADSQVREAAAESPGLGKLKSLLNVERPLKFGDFVWDDRGVGDGPLVIRVDMTNQLMSVFRGGEEIGTTVIVYGASELPTPVGDFHIRARIQDYVSRKYDAKMPYAMFLNDEGVAIHASTIASGRATHGCIGVPMDFARQLFNAAKVGDLVVVLPPASAA